MVSETISPLDKEIRGRKLRSVGPPYLLTDGREAFLVFLKYPLQVGQRPLLEKRQPQKYSRFLGTKVFRSDKAKLVIVYLDVATHTSSNHPGGTHAYNALL